MIKKLLLTIGLSLCAMPLFAQSSASGAAGNQSLAQAAIAASVGQDKLSIASAGATTIAQRKVVMTKILDDLRDCLAKAKTDEELNTCYPRYVAKPVSAN